MAISLPQPVPSEPIAEGSADWSNWSAGKDVFDERLLAPSWNNINTSNTLAKDHVYGTVNNHR